SSNVGPYSATALATTQAPVFTAPTGLSANATSPTQVSLSWGAASETGGTLSGYLIERCVGTGCTTFAQVGSTNAATTTFGDSGLLGSTAYTYRVRATDAFGNLGPYSAAASATTQAPVLTAPTSLTATAASSTQINLTWAAATETGGTVSGYLI